ncbi:roadblock/LC7 domain-containing protein [Frankia sp. AgB32]|uniref:roadblock/LC7 domain-containing protein n=1 Tax=Frankia sp. AgB32 TaxID=631119 RepID=UPI002010BED2|nr:roadblock/LC7 domain-containing protein [Frankia sp. AgB32]MCK9894390.1 roadblock/LC7 domain-containing protein [Frankia sp. AgB32]
MSTTTVTDAVLVELRALRDEVPGVTGGAVASADGLLIASDSESARPEVLAAMAAAALGLGRSTGQEAGLGALREVVTRCQGGHVIVHAVGETRLLVVLGDEGLDLDRLRRHAAPAVARLGTVLAA